MKKLSRLCTLLLVLILMVNLVTTAYAAGAVFYDGNARDFIFAPGSDYSPTDMFSDFHNVMPGDTITQRIYIRNDIHHGVKIKLYMRSLGAQLNTDDFLSQMQLTVEQVGDSILFAAPADQTAQLTDWTYLGTIYSGGEIDLDVTLQVPITMGDDYQHNIGYIDWQFKVEELPIEPTDPRLPKTGDTIFAAAAVMAISFSALVILFLFFKRKKKSEA